MASAVLRSLGDVLAICARDWTGRFNCHLVGIWDQNLIEQLHEELDRLAIDSNAAGERAMSSAALELSAYLCSFVELGRDPDEDQRQRLKRLSDAILEAAQGKCQPRPSAASRTTTASAGVIDLFSRAKVPAQNDSESAPHI